MSCKGGVFCDFSCADAIERVHKSRTVVDDWFLWPLCSSPVTYGRRHVRHRIGRALNLDISDHRSNQTRHVESCNDSSVSARRAPLAPCGRWRSRLRSASLAFASPRHRSPQGSRGAVIISSRDAGTALTGRRYARQDCPHDCPCGGPEQGVQSQQQPSRLIEDTKETEGFTKKIEGFREADFRLANRRLRPLGHLTAVRKCT